MQQSPGNAGLGQWEGHTNTFDTFVWEAAPSLDRALFEDLATCDYIRQGRNLIFCGPPACGKTHLSGALAVIATRLGHSVILADSSRFSSNHFCLSSPDQELVDCDLLMIDDADRTDMLGETLALRRRRSTMLITTIPAAELMAKLLPDDRDYLPLRDTWARPIVVEFKENAYYRRFRLRGDDRGCDRNRGFITALVQDEVFRP